MIYVQFLIGFLMYSMIATLSYSETFKKSIWFFPLGLLASLIANLIWLLISKFESNPSSLVIKGLYWDVMLLCIYLLVPILFFEAKFTTMQSCGLFLIVSGLILTKL